MLFKKYFRLLTPIKLNSTLLVHSHQVSNATTVRAYEDIPGPKPRPIIGNLLDTKACGINKTIKFLTWKKNVYLFCTLKGGDLDVLSFRDFLLQLQTKYGDIVRWSNPEFNPKKWHMTNRNVFLFDPEHIRQVFKADGSTPARPELEPLNKLHAKIGIKAGLVNR